MLRYTGARREEICGLSVHVACDDAVIDGKTQRLHYITIRTSEIRRIKNLYSERSVVLHPELIRLGFLDYVAAGPADEARFATTGARRIVRSQRGLAALVLSAGGRRPFRRAGRPDADRADDVGLRHPQRLRSSAADRDGMRPAPAGRAS
jgi:hypothetical protein